MERLSLDRDSFNRVRTLLLSPDDDNAVIALQTLQNIDFRSSLGYILYLYKICFREPSFWRENAPELIGRLHSVRALEQPRITYQKIMEILGYQKIPLSQVEFILEMVGETISKDLRQWGYGEVEEVIIKIKTSGL